MRITQPALCFDLVRGDRAGRARRTADFIAGMTDTFARGASQFCAPACASVECVATGGRVNGIAQWIALEMDEDALYENCPTPGATSCWAVLFHPLPHPIDASPGQEIRVCGSHNRHYVSIWHDPTDDTIRRLST